MMGLFPIFLVIAVGAAVLLVFSLEKIASGVLADKPISRKHFILATIALLVIWGLACVLITVSAGLSHSAKTISLLPARCAFLFVVFVGLPAAALLLLHVRSIVKETYLRKLKMASVLVFFLLISLIFFFAAKSGMWPPLAVASKYNFNNASRSLIKIGVNINQEDAYGYSPLWYAAGNGDLATTKLLIEKGADLKKWGTASLCQASINSHSDVAEFLINNGVDVNTVVYPYTEWTVLMAAVNAGHLDVVKMLVRKGASLDMRDKGGKTALMIAEGRKLTQIAEFLKTANAGIRNNRQSN